MDTIEAPETAPVVMQVRHVLEQTFPSAQIVVDQEDEADKVSGYVVWEGFEDQSILDRQTALYSHLRDALGEQARQVSLIFTYTPGEFAHMNSI